MILRAFKDRNNLMSPTGHKPIVHLSKEEVKRSKLLCTFRTTRYRPRKTVDPKKRLQSFSQFELARLCTGKILINRWPATDLPQCQAFVSLLGRSSKKNQLQTSLMRLKKEKKKKSNLPLVLIGFSMPVFFLFFISFSQCPLSISR